MAPFWSGQALSAGVFVNSSFRGSWLPARIAAWREAHIPTKPSDASHVRDSRAVSAFLGRAVRRTKRVPKYIVCDRDLIFDCHAFSLNLNDTWPIDVDNEGNTVVVRGMKECS
jgi:hypothetical protein